MYINIHKSNKTRNLGYYLPKYLPFFYTFRTSYNIYYWFRFLVNKIRVNTRTCELAIIRKFFCSIYKQGKAWSCGCLSNLETSSHGLYDRRLMTEEAIPLPLPCKKLSGE